jgi:hypothetical protein
MKERSESDELIKARIAQALHAAIDRKEMESIATKLGVDVGTLYKYIRGDMIPGGHVLWRACHHLGLVLDEKGLRPSRRRKGHAATLQPFQYDLPFLSESLEGEKVNVDVNRKKDAQYVHVRLRIKVAG